MRSWLWVLLAGCYDPHPAVGGACESACPTAGEQCVIGACVPLVAWWSFDEDPTSDHGATDVFGKHNGSCAPGECPDWHSDGVADDRVEFTGGQHITVDDLALAGPYTVMAWIAPDAAGSIIAKPLGVDTGNSWQLEILGNGNLSASGGSMHFLESTSTIPKNQRNTLVWTHVAATWDGTIKRLYINGVEDNQTPCEVTYDASPVVIGADINNGRSALDWKGSLDEVFLISTALAGELIAKFHADGCTRLPDQRACAP